MNTTPPQRWSPVSVLSRWAFLLWLTPLLALLTSLIWHLLEVRRDAAVGVVQVRATRLSSSPDFTALVRSPELMRAVVKEMNLPERWGTGTEQAAARLESLVSCHPVKGSSLNMVEVQQVPDVDVVPLCDSILRHAVAAHQVALNKIVAGDLTKLADGKPTIQAGAKQLDAATVKLAVLVLAHGIGSSESKKQADALTLMRNNFNMYLEGYIVETMDVPMYPGPVRIHEDARWQSISWSERLQEFSRSAWTVLSGALCLALVLAYLAEALEPRRGFDEALPVS